jgi:hypothetical protein
LGGAAVGAILPGDELEVDVDQVSEKDEAMWTYDDVAAHLKMSRRWVQDKVSAGLLRAYLLPGSRIVRFMPAEVRAFARGVALSPATPANTQAPSDAKKIA